MQRFVYFDLETIPCQDEAYRADLAAKVAPPGNIKKPESIAAWLDENRDTAADEAVAKTSFDGGRGHICTIAWAKDADPITVRHAETVEDEKGVIEAFFACLDPYHSETLVGHNITGFDIGFLRKRAIVLGVPLPSNSMLPRDPKPWDKNVHDTMTMWAGGNNRISMNDLCDILGVQGKDGFDGSMVADAWARGDHDTIAEYCKDDVSRTREIHKRFLAVNW
ncbi:MAG: 3'-5' exonuclease, partial [Paracoccaceae bacterium]